MAKFHQNAWELYLMKNGPTVKSDTPRSFRVFISSPGDVQQERQIAARILGRLSAEYADRCGVSAYFWEHEPMLATKDFQEQIPPPSTFDAVVCILWSRLGSRLHSRHIRPDGTPFSSGTEYEFEDAAISALKRGTPDLLVYFGRREVHFPAEPKDMRDSRISQYDALQDFVRRWFHDSNENTLKAAFNTYDHLAHFEELFEAHLRKILDKRFRSISSVKHTAPSSMVTWTQGSPFRGLSCFEETHAPVFFGRTQAIDEVLSAFRLQAANKRAFVLIFGGSGGGKSSLMRAGVIPLLMRPGVIEGIGLWRRAVLRPAEAGGDLFDGLAKVLTAGDALPELTADGTSVETLSRLLREQPAGVAMLVKGGLSQAARDLEIEKKLAAQPKARLVLGIDQMEELFTIDRITPEMRHAFIRAIDQLARSELVYVIATLRSEFFARCAESPELLALKEGAGQYQLAAPQASEISQMIRLPAFAAGLRYEEDKNGARLDDVLRDAAVRQPGALPLLQFVLEELYQKRESDGKLTFNAYHELGGLEGALRQRAETVFAGLPAEARAAFPGVFRKLVSMSEGRDEAFHRQWARLDSLVGDPAARGLLDAFIEARLLTTDRDSDGMSLVGLTHEALLIHWPYLKDWLAGEREFFITRARVEGAAARWREKSEDDEYLLPKGKPLAEAAELLSSAELSSEVRDFVERSVTVSRAAEKRQIRRLQFASVLFLLLAVLAGINAWRSTLLARQEERARTAEQAKRLEAQQRLAELFGERGRRALLDGVLGDAAIYLAASLIERPEMVATRLLLGQALGRLGNLPRSCFGHTDRIVAVGFLPQSNAVETADRVASRTVFTASRDGSVKLWDLKTGRLLRSFDWGGVALTAAQATPDGRRIISVSADGILAAWPLGSDSMRDAATVVANGAWINDLAIDTAGKFAATVGGDRCLALSDLSGASPSRLLQFGGYSGRVNRVAFIASDTLIVTGGMDSSLAVVDLAGRERFRLVKGQDGAVVALEGNSRSRLLAAGISCGEVRLWDLEPLMERRSSEASSPANISSGSEAVGLPPDWIIRTSGTPVTAIRFSPDGRFLAVGEEGGHLTLWNTTYRKRSWVRAAISDDIEDTNSVFSGGKSVRPNAGNSAELTALAWSPDGRNIVTGHRDGTIRVRLAGSGRPIAVFRTHSAPVTAIVIDEEGRLVSGASDGSVYSRQIREGLLHVRLNHGAPLCDASFDHSGRRVVTGGRDGRAVLWDAERGIPIRSLIHNASGEWCLRAGFSPDDAFIFTLSGTSVRVWNASDGTCVAVRVASYPPAHFADGVWASSSAELYLAYRCDDKQHIYVPDGGWFRWRWTDDAVTARSAGQTRSISHLEVSADGIWVMTTSSEGYGTVFDGNGVPRHECENAAKLVIPGGENEILRGGKGGEIGRRDFLCERDRLTKNVSGARTTVLTVASNGALLLVGDAGGGASLLDARTLEVRVPLTGHRAGLLAGGFSPDASLAITAGEDHSVKLWDAGSGRSLAICEGHSDWVLQAAFAPDGTRFLSGSLDGSCCLWDFVSGVGNPASAAQQALFHDIPGSGDEYLQLARRNLQEAIASRMDPLAQNQAKERIARDRGRRAFVDDAIATAAPYFLEACRLGDASLETTFAAGYLEREFADLIWGRELGISQAYCIQSLKFSSRSSVVFLACSNGTVLSFGLADGRMRWRRRAYPGRLWGMVLSADEGTILLYGANNLAVRLSTEDGRETGRYPMASRIMNVALSPDGRTIYLLGPSGLVSILDGGSGSERQSLEIIGSANGDLQISPDGSRLLGMTADSVRLWDVLASPSRVVFAAASATLGFSPAISQGSAFSKDGKHFLFQGASGSLQIRCSEDGALEAILEPGPEMPNSVSFSPDGKRVAAGCMNGVATVWDLPEKRLSRFIRTGVPGGLVIGGWSLDGNGIIVHGDHSFAPPCAWDLQSGRILRRFVGYGGQSAASAVDPDGRVLVTISQSGRLCAWRFPQAGTVDEQPRAPFGLGGIAVSADGRRMALLATDSSGIVWNLPSLEVVASFPGTDRRPVMTSIATGGMRMAILDEGNLLRFFDIRNGCCLASTTFQGRETVVSSPDGWRHASVRTEGGLEIRDGSGGVENRIASAGEGCYLMAPAWSGDGNTLATIEVNGSIRVCTHMKASPTLLLQIDHPHQGSRLGIALNASGNMLCSWAGDRCARLWELPSGQLHGELFGHRLAVREAAFAATGSRLVTVDHDRVARLWDTERSVLIAEIGDTQRMVRSAVFSPDGQWLAIVDERGVTTLHSSRDGEIWYRVERESLPAGLAFAASGTCLVTAGGDGDIRMLPLEYSSHATGVFERILGLFSRQANEEYSR